MSLRFILHIAVCLLLAAAGWWLFTQLDETGHSSITSIQVAGYWFGILVFILFSWFFYWILNRRSTKAWFIAQGIAVVIAISSTVALLLISHIHEQQRKAEEELLNQEPEILEQGVPEQDGLEQEDLEIQEEESDVVEDATS